MWDNFFQILQICKYRCYLLGISLLGPLLRSLMELRTELLAVSCVGDFISCQPRSLLKFNNISNIIHEHRKNAIVIARRSYIFEWIAKVITHQKIFRVLTKIISIYYIELYLGSPFIFIVVVIRVAGFFRRCPRGRWQSEILQYSRFYFFPSWSRSLLIFTSLYFIHHSIPASALSGWSLRTSRLLFRIIFRRWLDHRFYLRDDISLRHFIFFQRYRIGLILWFGSDVFIFLNFFDRCDFDRGRCIVQAARFIRCLCGILRKQILHTINKILKISSRIKPGFRVNVPVNNP